MLGFVGGFLYAQFVNRIVPTIKQQRADVPTRTVSAEWRLDRFSPGHSQDVINLALECNECHDPARADFGGVDFSVCTACHQEQASHPHVGAEGEITERFTCHASSS